MISNVLVWSRAADWGQSALRLAVGNSARRTPLAEIIF
jgi:hypothetical protein